MSRRRINFVRERPISTVVLIAALIVGLAALTWQAFSLQRLKQQAHQVALGAYERQAEQAAAMAARQIAEREEPKIKASNFSIAAVLSSLESVRVPGTRARTAMIDELERSGRVEFEVTDRTLVSTILNELSEGDRTLTWRPLLLQAPADGVATTILIVEVK